MFCNHFYIHDATKSNCKIDSPRSKADVILVDADDVTDEVLFRRSRSADVGVVDVAAAPLRPTPTPPPPPRYGGDGRLSRHARSSICSIIVSTILTASCVYVGERRDAHTGKGNWQPDQSQSTLGTK